MMKKLALVAAVGALVFPAITQAALVTAGELVADLRIADLSASSATWANSDATGLTAGDFSTKGGGNLNVATIGGVTALYVNETAANALDSANTATTAGLGGNAASSVELWIYADAALPGGQSPAAWGSTDVKANAVGYSGMREFRYAGGGNGMYTGWYGNDYGYDNGTADLITDQWCLLTYVYDGVDTLTTYLNGSVVGSATMAYTMNTDGNTLIRVGSGREGSGGGDDFAGYIGDVRIHSGALSAADVSNNFNEDALFYGIPEPATIGLLGVFGAGMLVMRRRFMI